MKEAEWRKATKTEDTVLTVLLFDPFVRLWLPLVLRLGITPNMVTLSRLGVAIFGAAMFAGGNPHLGAISFIIWYLEDCIDGKLARLTGRASIFGEWMDRITDRLGIGALGFALGVWLCAHGQIIPGMLAVLLILVWFLRCMNGDRLGWIRERLEAETRPEPAAIRDTTAEASNTAPIGTASLRTRLRLFSARTRVTMFIVHDVEWLTIALVIGPITGLYTLCFVIASGGITVQAALYILIFWGRRRDMVTLGCRAKPGGAEAADNASRQLASAMY